MTVPLSVKSASGATLSARLELPPGQPRAYALFAHCFTCSKDLRAVVTITRELARVGIATMRFDFTGLGESEGEFAETSFSSNVADLVAVAAAMREQGMAPSLLIGHSLGGAAVLQAAHQIEEVRAVATIAAPSGPEQLLALLADDESVIREQGEAEVTIAGRSFRIRRELLEDLERLAPVDAVRTLHRPLLMFHAPLDQSVGIESARRLYEAARHPKSFVALDGANHLLSRRADATYVAQVIGAWAPRYLDPLEEPELEAKLVRVEGGTAGLAQSVRVGTHHLRADEPTTERGTDTGPTPYELLLAGLGACTSMTLRLYADHKGWPLESVSVDLTHHRVHAKDCEDCEHTEGMIQRIDRSIELRGELDDEQRARLMEIADRCPVHRTLLGQIEIHTSQRDG